MRRYTILLVAGVFCVHPVLAHDTGEMSSSRSVTTRIKAYVETPIIRLLNGVVDSAQAAGVVRISIENGYRTIESDGIPQHATGNFPNPGNPNTIREQQYHYRVPLHPRSTGAITPLGLSPFGVAINGVPFDPGAAEFWNNDRQSGWQYEALSGAINLGVDQNNAHVQPNGAYHYHGMPNGLIERPGDVGAPLLIGYAADGFPIYGPMGYQQPGNSGSGMKLLASSYRVKSGPRPGGPGGTYDGSFVQDYEYVAGAGDLDECNGRNGVTREYPGGTYYYVITDRFPFIPRCFKGVPDSSFRHGPMERRGMNGNSQRPGRGQGMPGDRRGRGSPPAEVIEACQGRSEGESVSFRTPRGESVQGICRDLNGEMAAVPAGGRPPMR